MHNNVLFRVSRRSPLARPLSTLLTRMDAPLVSATREAAAHSPPAVTPAASTASTASSLRAYAAHAMAPAPSTPSPGSRGDGVNAPSASRARITPAAPRPAAVSSTVLPPPSCRSSKSGCFAETSPSASAALCAARASPTRAAANSADVKLRSRARSFFFFCGFLFFVSDARRGERGVDDAIVAASSRELERVHAYRATASRDRSRTVAFAFASRVHAHLDFGVGAAARQNLRRLDGARGDGDVQRRVPLPVPRAEHACGVEIKHARQHSPVIRARRDVRGGARVTPRGYFDGVLLAVLAVAARRRNRHRTRVRSIRNRRFRAERQEAQRARLPAGVGARTRAPKPCWSIACPRARRPSTRARAAGDSERVSFCLGRRARRAPPRAAAFSRRTPPPRHRTPTARRRRRRSPHTRAPARRRPPTLAPRPSSRRGPRPPAWRRREPTWWRRARRRLGFSALHARAARGGARGPSPRRRPSRAGQRTPRPSRRQVTSRTRSASRARARSGGGSRRRDLKPRHPAPRFQIRRARAASRAAHRRDCDVAGRAGRIEKNLERARRGLNRHGVGGGRGNGRLQHGGPALHDAKHVPEADGRVANAEHGEPQLLPRQARIRRARRRRLGGRRVPLVLALALALRRRRRRRVRRGRRGRLGRGRPGLYHHVVRALLRLGSAKFQIRRADARDGRTARRVRPASAVPSSVVGIVFFSSIRDRARGRVIPRDASGVVSVEALGREVARRR